MPNETIFKVGDEVVVDGSITVGVVKKITDKRKDVIVRFNDHYTKTYSCDGRDKGHDIWHRERIIPLDGTEKKKIEDAHIRHRAMDIARKWASDMPMDVARKIIEIEESRKQETNND